MSLIAAAALSAALAAASAAPPAAPLAGQSAEPSPDWAALLRVDARAVHDALQDSHPGPYDDANPEFRQGLDAGLAQALARADTVRDVGGYWWALREYVASFNDGHTALAGSDKLPALESDWPGFLTGYRGGRQVVTVRDDEAAPPVGAELVQCDGVDAETLAANRIGRFVGLWSLNTMRVATGDRLFRALSNPYTPALSACTFRSDTGGVVEYRLRWRPYEVQARERTQAQLGPLRAKDPIGLRVFAPGRYWITASEFDGNPTNESGLANTALIEELRRRSDELRGAEQIVLDLRGNNGGSSHWSREMARALWGDTYVAAHSPRSGYVEWRASDANIAHVEGIRERYRGSNEEMFGWADRILTGLKAAREEGKPLWRQTSAQAASDTPTDGGENPVRAKVYVLTDYYCGSACLDAADLWLALGAVQIGEETFADSQYMEVRMVDLPSGNGRLVVPTKVYRDRPRAPNQTLVPTHPRAGPLTDTAALEAWVRTLP